MHNIVQINNLIVTAHCIIAWLLAVNSIEHNISVGHVLKFYCLVSVQLATYRFSLLIMCSLIHVVSQFAHKVAMFSCYDFL